MPKKLKSFQLQGMLLTPWPAQPLDHARGSAPDSRDSNQFLPLWPPNFFTFRCPCTLDTKWGRQHCDSDSRSAVGNEI